MNKKAVSEIITSVLIIVMAIAAVSIVSVYVFSLTSNAPALAPQINCIEMQKNRALIVTLACFDEDTNEIEVMLFRASQVNKLGQVEFVLSDGVNEKVQKCGELICGSCSLPEPGRTERYFLSSDNPEKITKVSVSSEGCFMNAVSVRKC